MTNISTDIDKKGRIFCNRSLNMKQIKAIGFDLDYTIALYKPETFEALAYEKTVKKLVADGYPAELLNWKFDKDSMVRGLVIDKKRGNILKMDRHRYVKVAYHGFKEIPREELRKLYDAAKVLIYEEPDFALIDTLFSLADAYLFSQLVDFKESNPTALPKEYAQIFKDIRTAIDLAHRDGSIKAEVLKNPSLYIERDPGLIETLAHLKNSGRKLFIVTNSLWNYTNAVMNFVMGNDSDVLKDDWLEYFEVVITGAAKPAFFMTNNPIYEVDTTKGYLQNVELFKPGHKVFQGGNFQRLHDMIGVSGSQILYVGDHIFGDILRSKKELGWRTMLVVMELERELEILYRNYGDMKRYDELRQLTDSIEEQIQLMQRMLETIDPADRTKPNEYSDASIRLQIQKLVEQRNTTRDIMRNHLRLYHKKFHPIWGESMKTGFQNSRFATQVENYACLYTSRLSNLGLYSTEHGFQSTRDFMPHDFM